MERHGFPGQDVLSRLALVALGLAGLLAGCGLFDLRDPQEPSGIEIPWEQQVEPRIALKNLEIATENRSAGNFERSLTEDYRFVFSVFDVVEDDTVWTRDQDIQALTTLFQNEAEVELTWTVADSSPGTEFVYRNLQYFLVFRRSVTDSSVYGGQCNLHFRFDGIQWFIYRWVDNLAPIAERTWGYARRHPTEP